MATPFRLVSVLLFLAFLPIISAAPVITNVNCPSTTYNSITVTFDTNDAGNSTVLWGINSTHLPNSAGQNDNVFLHTVVISGLTQQNYRYYFNATSCDSSGCGTSLTYSCRTGSLSLPTITNVKPAVIGATFAQITFDVAPNADGSIMWGTATNSYSNFNNDSSVWSNHVFGLSPLTPLKTYYYMVRACTSGGCALSSENSFTTLPDTTPAVISSGFPIGTLPAGSSVSLIGVDTNEAATCRFHVIPTLSYGSMIEMNTLNYTYHYSSVGPLTTPGNYTIYVKCADMAGIINPTPYAFSFFILPGDTSPPVISNGQPSGILPIGTTVSSISFDTDENAICRMSNNPNAQFTSMMEFEWTESLHHSANIGPLSIPDNYSVYIKCNDSKGNINPAYYLINFIIPSSVVDNTPQVTLNSPPDGFITSSTSINFSCTATDDIRLSSIVIYIRGPINSGGGGTATGTSFTTVFNAVNLVPGNYNWYCAATDNSSQTSYSPSNFSFQVFVPTYGFSISPSQDLFGASNATGSITNRTFTLGNTGNMPLSGLSCSPDYPWARIYNCPAGLAVGSNASIIASFDTSGLLIDVYLVRLHFSAANVSTKTAWAFVNVSTTPFNPIPPIADVAATPSYDSATIRWNTPNINSNSAVIYGLNATALANAVNSTDNVQSHSILLPGLAASTQYFYYVMSCTLGGCNSSTIRTFNTTATPAGCAYSNPACSAGTHCSNNACVSDYTGGSPGNYVPGGNVGNPSPSASAGPSGSATPRPSGTASISPSASVSAEVKVEEISDEFASLDMSLLADEDKITVEKMLEEAELLRKQGKMEQAFVVYSNAKRYAEEALSSNKDKKASIAWFSVGLFIFAILGIGGFYYYQLKKHEKELEAPPGDDQTLEGPAEKAEMKAAEKAEPSHEPRDAKEKEDVEDLLPDLGKSESDSRPSENSIFNSEEFKKMRENK
ncbi:MAG: fibronectin type III domain-containing protein [Candidatus Micrarchaeota archaeon]